MVEKTIKVYDWNGVAVSLREFWPWLQREHRELYTNYRVRPQQTSTDEARWLKETYKPEVLSAMEQGIADRAFDMPLNDDFVRRTSLDREQGYATALFTSITPEQLAAQAAKADLSLDGFMVFHLDDILRAGKLAPETTKESPLVYVSLSHSIRGRGYNRIATYVDDAEARAKAAVEANKKLRETNSLPFEHIFQFNPDQKEPKREQKGFVTVNNLMDVELPYS